MQRTEVGYVATPRPPGLPLPTLVAGAIAVLLIGLAILPFGRWQAIYLPFVLATALMVRSVPATPGSFLRKQLTRRTLVALLGVVCLGLMLATPAGPAPTGLIPWLLLVLLLMNVALGQATRRIAAAPDETVDEREEQFRNRVHREAYWLFAGVLAAGMLGLNCASLGTRRWIWDALHGGAPLAMGQLMFFLPAMTLAWLEPDTPQPEPSAARPSRQAISAAAMAAVALVTPLALSATFVIVPVRTTAAGYTSAPSANSGERCVLMQARKSVGWGMGAVLPLDGLACADGKRAQEEFGFNQGDCHPKSADYATVTTIQCSRRTDADGTMRFTYTARVESLLLPFFKRDVTLRAAVDRNGRVMELP